MNLCNIVWFFFLQHVVWFAILAEYMSEGGGLFELQITPPPSPPSPPKFSNPPFSKLRFWGKVLAPKAPFFFLAS